MNADHPAPDGAAPPPAPHRRVFDCRYPIVCAAMNQVSDAALAIAVHRAGAFASLSMPNYIEHGALNVSAYERELQAFQDATGSTNLMLSVGSTLLLHDRVMLPFLRRGFRHVELFHWSSAQEDWPRVLRRARQLTDRHGLRVFFKISTGHVAAGLDYAAIVLKGPDGAGRSADGSPPLSEAFDACRASLPGCDIVVSGGIGHADQVAEYLNRGAVAVAIGSLFAAARESRVSDEVKSRLVAASAAELQLRGANRLQGLFAGTVDGDNSNLTRTLATGIRRADQGGIFIGKAVDQINEVLTVQQIVERLMVLAPASGPESG